MKPAPAPHTSRPALVGVETNRFQTPILLVVFNRPDTTKLVLENLRSVRPPQLYVAADGPRPSVGADLDRCEATRRIATDVDWDCDLHTRFQSTNVGCGLNVSSAITWFFENVRAGIILEDDCLPSPSFYVFCEQLLEYYRDDARVMHIGGDNFQYGRIRGNASYYFSRFAHTWGWASWSRAWEAYDFSLRPTWEIRDVWSTQWQLTIEHAAGVAIVPNANLVQNVGFGAAATHTTFHERASALRAQDIDFPLRHPATHAIDRDADRFTYYVHFRNVRFPSLLWVYGLWDWLRAALKTFKRRLSAN